MPRTIALIYLALRSAVDLLHRSPAGVAAPRTPSASCSCRPARAGCSSSAPRCSIYVMLRRYEKRDAAPRARAARIAARSAAHERGSRAARRRAHAPAGSRQPRARSRSRTPSRTTCARLCAACPASARSCGTAPASWTKSRGTICSASTKPASACRSLIEDLLGLSRISRSELNPRPDESQPDRADAAAALRERYPGAQRAARDRARS